MTSRTVEVAAGQDRATTRMVAATTPGTVLVDTVGSYLAGAQPTAAQSAPSRLGAYCDLRAPDDTLWRRARYVGGRASDAGDVLLGHDASSGGDPWNTGVATGWPQASRPLPQHHRGYLGDQRTLAGPWRLTIRQRDGGSQESVEWAQVWVEGVCDGQ